MKPYKTYKDSGVEWIGEIPEHWKKSSLKWYSTIYSGGTPSKVEEDYWIKGTIPWLNSGTVNQGDITKASNYITEEAFQNSSAKWIPSKSLIIALAGQGKTKGMVGQVQFETTCNQSLSVIVPNKKIFNRFLYYWLKSNYQNIRNLGGGDKRDGLNLVMIGGIPIPVPSKEEQTQIANYLNYKTTQLDTLITKKEQLISLLQEERTAIINQAVTKGLDLNVPMKVVKEDGLDKIPNHWKLLKFKWLAPILTCGVASTPEYVDETIGVPFLSAQNVKNNKMRLDKYKYISVDLHEKLTKHRKPLNGDLLVTRVGAGIGDACIVDCDFDFSVYVSLTHIRVDESIVNNKFIMYFFSTDYCKFLNNYGTVTGGGVGNLNVNNVERYKIPIPSLEEQNRIVKFIEHQNEKSDILQAKFEQEIELLKEYKTALISEVVTGKVDVREEVLN